jgi:hypothetical protein
VSDSVGETADLVTRAALSQFNSGQAELRRFSYVESEQAILDILETADPDNSVIVFTLIYPELREFMIRETDKRTIPVVDVMGPTMNALSSVLQAEPKLEAGIIRRLDEDYFQRVEAIEFAVKYDDGKEPEGLKKADIVLIGVSRTSKTPVSMYLANRQYKVANVPLVPEVEPPDELFQISSNRIIGLTVSTEKLHQIRRERLRSIGLKDGASYADIQRIRHELQYAHRLFERLGCKVVDVSSKAVEETANVVLESLKEVHQQ